MEKYIALFMDHNSLKIILRNVLDNALKYTENGGNVSISVTEDKDEYCNVLIKDSGIGMSPETISKCLNEEIRYSKADTSGKSSTGLGLNLCSSIIKKNNGKMEIDSQERKGTTITLKLIRYERN